MSFAALKWAWQQHLSPSRKSVLLALAWHADEHGYCWPGQARLAHMTGLSEKTVGRAIEDMRRRNLLRSQKRYTDSGQSQSNEYFLALHQVGTVSPSSGQRVPYAPPTAAQAGGHRDRQKVMVNLQEISQSVLEKQRQQAEEAAETYWQDQAPSPDREAWLARLKRRPDE